MNVICGSAVKIKRGHPWRDVWRRRGEQVVVLGSRGAVKVPPRHSEKINGGNSGPLISIASIQGVEINQNGVGRNRKREYRKQKVSAESRNWQKDLSFCRKRLVSAERGWFLQKEVDFCRKVGFCRNTESRKLSAEIQ